MLIISSREVCSSPVCFFFYDHLSSRFSFNCFVEDQVAQEGIIFPSVMCSIHIKLASKQSNINHVLAPEKKDS